MPSATLVVDCGAHSTGAAIVVGDQASIVRDPLTAAALWPSQLSVEAGTFYAGSAAARTRLATPRYAIDGPRRAVDAETVIALGEREFSPITAMSAFLGSIRAEASRIAPDRIDRLTLTVPTPTRSRRRRDLLIAAGEGAGFGEVELLGSAAAVVLDAAGAPGWRTARWSGLRPGRDLVHRPVAVNQHEVLQLMQETRPRPGSRPAALHRPAGAAGGLAGGPARRARRGRPARVPPGRRLPPAGQARAPADDDAR